MRRKISEKSARKDREEVARNLEAILQLVAEDEAPRREFTLAIKKFTNTCQLLVRESSMSEDKWLLRVEESATKLCEGCQVFRDDRTERRLEIYRLVLSLEDDSRILSSDLLDPARVVIVCRSFMASYRLQSQSDEQVIDEIHSFLSSLYLNIGYATETNEVRNHDSKRSNIIVTMNGWVDCIENRMFLLSTPWIEALEEMHSLLTSPGGSVFKQYHTMNALDTGSSKSQNKSIPSNNGGPARLTSQVVAADTTMDVVENFLGESQYSSTSFVMVVGPQGSGKTFMCDEIETIVRSHETPVQGTIDSSALTLEILPTPSHHVIVVRPTLPIDLMGASLGGTEYTMVSIFEFARQSSKCILLFDDIDRILESGQDGDDSVGVGSLENNAQPHRQTRLFSSFLSQVDSLRSYESCVDHQILIVGTASSLANVNSIGRVDKIFLLKQPNKNERRDIIARSLGLDAYGMSGKYMNSTLLADLIDCTVGRSRSELVQYCRHAITTCSLPPTNSSTYKDDSIPTEVILRTMKTSLQSLAPESLRNGAVSDFVDMKVLTARDLIAKNKNGSSVELPLFGSDARNAWDEMNALIVMPLCQANALDDLLYGDVKEDRKTVCGGVLLAGNPGCGKSCLAYHCATVAANIVPSMTLLDVSCTSLVHKEVGGSERALRHLFESARAAAPCILLMDGIENIAAVRGHDNTTEGTMDRILSTLLVELDGVESQSNVDGKIAVIGITHNERWIDSALRRPGRLEKVIKLHNPEYDARYEIIRNELISISTPTAKSIDETELAKFVAERTDDKSGAEVLALCREARMESLRGCIDQSNKILDELDGSITRAHFIAAGLRESAN